MKTLDIIEKMLKDAYPRALTYTELWQPITNGLGTIEKEYRSGGSATRTLLKKGKIKQITSGYYCWVPN